MQVCEIGYKTNLDLHTLLAASSNITKRQRKEKGLLRAIKDVMGVKKIRDPQQKLYFHLHESYCEISREIDNHLSVKVNLSSIREYIKELITNLESNTALPELSTMTRKGSSRCTDILPRVVSVRWQRPGQLIENLLADKSSETYKLHDSLVVDILKTCENEFADKSPLLRPGKVNSDITQLQNVMGSIHLRILKHVTDIHKTVQKVIEPKEISEKTLWLKYEPYLFKPIFGKLLQLYELAHRKMLDEIESVTRSSYDLRESLRLSYKGTSETDVISAFDGLQTTTNSALTTTMSRMTAVVDEASLILDSERSSTSSDRSEDSGRGSGSSESYRTIRKQKIDIDNLNKELNNIMENKELESSHEDNSADYNLREWAKHIQTDVLNNTIPTSIVSSLLEILQTISNSETCSVSADLLQQKVVALLIQLTPKERSRLFTLLLIIQDYLSDFYKRGEYDYTITMYKVGFVATCPIIMDMGSELI